MHEEAIRRAIKELAGKPESMIAEGKVQGVDWPKRTCEVLLADGRVLPAVRLKAIANDADAGLCLKPVQGSTVLVAAVGAETEQCVLLCDEVEAVELKMQDVTLTIEQGKVKLEAKQIEADADSTVWNGGNNKGLAVVDKLAMRFNQLEAALTEIKAVFAGHTHNVTAIGEPTEQPAAPLTYTVPNSTGSDFENNKIKH